VGFSITWGAATTRSSGARVGDCFCIRGKSERARAIQMPRGRRIWVNNGTGRCFYHRYQGNSLASQGFGEVVDEKRRPSQEAGPLSSNLKENVGELLIRRLLPALLPAAPSLRAP
jgi:hypothetical protein